MGIRNVVIVGSGCAGHTAALYTARAKLEPLVLEGHEPGGQLSLTTLVENFPGFPEGIQGPELIANMRRQAERFGAEYQLAHVTGADLRSAPFTLKVGKETVQTRTLIIASGASARWLGLPSGKNSELPVSAMFLGIGHIPNAKIFEGQLDMDQDGYLKTTNNVFTKIPGVYACGDVQDRRYRQAITAAGSGCMAALEAEKYLEDKGIE